MLSGCAMSVLDRFKSRFPGPAAALETRIAIVRKAISFALVGVVNTIVDAGLFFLAYAYLTSRPALGQVLSSFAAACGCASAATVTLVAANVFSWFIAVSGSYVMNSYITFAAESGRQLRLRSWATFVASGVLGAIANTATLVIAAQVVPVWMAKGCAILVSFMANFALSHFVVFRTRDRRSAVHERAVQPD